MSLAILGIWWMIIVWDRKVVGFGVDFLGIPGSLSVVVMEAALLWWPRLPRLLRLVARTIGWVRRGIRLWLIELLLWVVRLWLTWVKSVLWREVRH